MIEVPLRRSALARWAVALVLVAAAGCQSNTSTTIRGKNHFVDGYDAVRDDGRVNVIIEVPAGTLAKWEVDKSEGVLVWEMESGSRRVVQFLGYPGNYGMVPRTLLPDDEGGDGDPLDILILGASLERGSIVPARLIGVLEMTDRGERDDKLVAVADGTPFAGVRSMIQLEKDFPGAVLILRTWFESYKGPGKIRVDRVGGPERARAILDSATGSYAEAKARVAK